MIDPTSKQEIGTPESTAAPTRESWGLVRVKREWVPEWLWRVFCFGPSSWRLVLFTPWREILTTGRVPERPKGASC